MPRIAVVKGVDAPAGTVWELVSDFADVSWIPVIDDVDVDGEGLGMTRTIHGSGDQPILETLTHRDDEQMELGYSITNSPLPVTRFEALVTVRPAPDGTGSDITWDVDYDPQGSDPQASATQDSGPQDSGTQDGGTQDSDEAAAVAARESIEAVYGMMAGWLADAATQRGRR